MAEMGQSTPIHSATVPNNVRSINGIVATCDLPTVRALLVAGAAGYSRTLVRRILPLFTGPAIGSQVAHAR
jgi:hypothetical protein